MGPRAIQKVGSQKPQREQRPQPRQPIVAPIIAGSIGYYMLWIALHYAAANLYVHYCTPPTLYGALTSPFLIATPHCSALRWIIAEGSNTILTMWSLVGVWCIVRITQRTA